MSTCGGTKVAFLSCTLVLLLVSPQTTSIVDAQTDDFPVGLDLIYNDKWTSGQLTNEVSTEIKFTQWYDESHSIVEINRDGTIIQITYPNSPVYLGSGVPLWTDTSQWSNGQNISFQGRIYSVSTARRTVEAGSYDCWILTYQSFQSSYIYYYYDRQFGFLIIFISTVINDISFNQQVYELIDGNLDDYVVNPFHNVDTVLTLGVLVEICVILYLFYRRYKS